LFATQAAARPLNQRPKVQHFIHQMVVQHHFDRQKLNTLFKHVTLNTTTQKRSNKPFERVPWLFYKAHFLTPARVKSGVTFWKKNARTLRRAEKQYGVPARLIVAFLGVETKYGEAPGKIRVIDALSTLAFTKNPRAPYFKKELTQFLLLTREQHFNPLKIRGSYAGAMGLPQFMPSSYRAFAVDFSKDHKIDLLHNEADAIGSIANYLKKHGWQKNQPTVLQAKIDRSQFHNVTINSIKPNTTLKKLSTQGVHLLTRHPISKKSNVTLIRLGIVKPTYWLGFKNFYVITRYNHNIKYAMVVYKLSKQIKKSYLKGHHKQHPTHHRSHTKRHHRTHHQR